MKRCIFHIPSKITKTGNSGSHIRPRKIIEALKTTGYEVDVVMGYGKERKKSIEAIKQNIKNGISYDFLYSESSTMPTLLTEKHHLPTYPMLDFGLFKTCKKAGIPIGLFYRDMYWKFPIYREKVNGLKYLVSYIAYNYDLIQYEKYLDVFFLPSKGMLKYIDSKKLKSISYELPPGCDYDESVVAKKKQFYSERERRFDHQLDLFYVGGLGSQYILDDFFKAVSDMDQLKVTVCCRENEWKAERERLLQYIGKNIEIVHKSGAELTEYYQNADICVACFKPDAYRKMAVPIKLFEYLSYTVPILATNDTALGEYVQQNGIGWSVNYSEQDIKNLLLELLHNYNKVVQKHYNCISQLSENTWTKRAEYLSTLLIKKRTK